MFDLTLEKICALLTAKAFGTPIDVALLTGMTETDWQQLLSLSVKEGVMADCYDALETLPEAIKKPPRNIMFSWAAGVDMIENQYNNIKAVADELKEYLKSDGVNMRILKGLELATLHPVPAHREFSDLDVYTDNYLKSNRILLNMGAKRRHADFKHTSFSFKGVLIENHIHFMSGNDMNKYKIIDDYLIKNAFEESKLHNHIITHFMGHALHHFPDSWRLRYFYDWAILLHFMRGKWNIEEFEKLFTDAGCKRLVDAFCAITVDLFNLPDNDSPPYLKDKTLIDTIYNEMQKPMKAGFYNIIHHRILFDRLSNPSSKSKMIQTIRSVLEVLTHTAKYKLQIYFGCNRWS